MRDKEKDEMYMRRCLELAAHGKGKVRPNPMVGAVIVREGRIIGEGYHRRYGEGHAEVNAVASVSDESLLHGATLYVSLEPCSHYGKTPPCADLILSKGISRVVMACLDPNPQVSGRGAQKLREAGVETRCGVLEAEAKALNRHFMTYHTKHRPYIYLKWAQSADGYIDKLRNDASEPPVRLSTPLSRQIVHKRRSEVAAILVGTRTALLDNPSLTVRYWSGTSPVRLVLDRELRIPSTYHLLDGSRPTLVFTAKEAENRPNLEYVRLDFQSDVLPQILAEMYARKLDSLLVEGGACLLNAFLEEGLYDKVWVETAPLRLGSGVKAPFWEKDLSR
jgi:diaminohydroxyphosphoribosylaminopyrimidine deaminase/5-amino-6-(5-phosphoribosylamino)uracil reductase